MHRRDFLRQLTLGAAGCLLAGTPFRLLAEGAVVESVPVERVYVSLGTLVRFQVYHEEPREALQAIRKAAACIQKIHDRMSVQEPASTLSRWNDSRTGREVVLDELTAEAVEEALRAFRLTEGRFDPTVGAAVKSYQAGKTPPVQQERLGEWLPHERQLLKPHPGVALDLGGSAKGWAVDRAMEILIAAGCRAALVNAGGDLRVFGAPPGEEAWTIGIRDPRRPDEVLRRLALRDAAVATSGDYETEGSATLVDPRDFSRIRLHGSVSVVASSCGLADALSTALCVEPDLRLLPEQTGGLIARRAGEQFVIQEHLQFPLNQVGG
ncbi:MAG: FAD:protein FMN transferase [Calditrichaeota bacterium]|nr:MAG: FAD:protein FMN transferase [Calditrichota bacterium]